MSLEQKPPVRVSVDDEEGIVKQAVYSAFSPKSPIKYIYTMLPFPMRTPSSMFSPVINSGANPPLPDLLYVAAGYVEDGYVQ
jgi:hypothetical protein